jgi:hypothetical protein
LFIKEGNVHSGARIARRGGSVYSNMAVTWWIRLDDSRKY